MRQTSEYKTCNGKVPLDCYSSSQEINYSAYRRISLL